MKPVAVAEQGLELEIHAEELELKIAPDDGETVLPLTQTRPTF